MSIKMECLLLFININLLSADTNNKCDCQVDEEVKPYLEKLRQILPPVWLPNGAAKILPFLYLGGEDSATKFSFLKDIGVTHIVNCAEGYCTTGIEFYKKEMANIKYLGFDAKDEDGYDIMQHFDDVYTFIEDARKTDGKVLIHCLAGVNRSGALAVGYVMLHNKIGPLSAVNLVARARGSLLSNETFQLQILMFAKQRNMLALDENMSI